MTLANFPKTWAMPAEQHFKLKVLQEWIDSTPAFLDLPVDFFDDINDVVDELGPVDLEDALVACDAHVGGYEVCNDHLYVEVYLDSSDGSTPDLMLQLVPIG